MTGTIRGMSAGKSIMESLKTIAIKNGSFKITDRISKKEMDLSEYINKFSSQRSPESLFDVYCQVSDLEPVRS